MFKFMRTMFGAPNTTMIEALDQKRKYTAEVDTLLNNTLQIVTDNTKNDAFPGVLKYYEYIDEVWTINGTVDDAVARIGTLYFMGVSKSGTNEELEEGKLLEPRLRLYLQLCRENKTVATSNLDHYLSLIDKYTLTKNPPEQQFLNCEMDYECTKDWFLLEPTNKAEVKFCKTCQHDVYLCLAQEELDTAKENGLCIAYFAEPSSSTLLKLAQESIAASRNDQNLEPIVLMGRPSHRRKNKDHSRSENSERLSKLSFGEPARKSFEESKNKPAHKTIDTPTKAKAIRKIIKILEEGIDSRSTAQLQSLEIALFKDFSVGSGIGFKLTKFMFAIYPLCKSENFEAFVGIKELQDNPVFDISLFSEIIDQLALEISRSFEEDSPEYASLETGDLYL